jgi:hypothetical protein
LTKVPLEHLTDQGVMEPALLYEQPFTTVAPTGPEQLFDEERVTKLFTRIKAINDSAWRDEQGGTRQTGQSKEFRGSCCRRLPTARSGSITWKGLKCPLFPGPKPIGERSIDVRLRKKPPGRYAVRLFLRLPAPSPVRFRRTYLVGESSI